MKKIFLMKLKKRDERLYFQKNRFVILDNDEIRLKFFLINLRLA